MKPHTAAIAWQDGVRVCQKNLYILQCSLVQQTSHNTKMFSSHSSTFLTKATKTTKKKLQNPETEKQIVVFVLFFFPCLPTHSTHASFLHQTSPRQLPLFYVKINWQAGIWTMLWGAGQSPSPMSAALGHCFVSPQFPDIVCVCCVCECVCDTPFQHSTDR